MFILFFRSFFLFLSYYLSFVLSIIYFTIQFVYYLCCFLSFQVLKKNQARATSTTSIPSLMLGQASGSKMVAQQPVGGLVGVLGGRVPDRMGGAKLGGRVQ